MKKMGVVRSAVNSIALGVGRGLGGGINSRIDLHQSLYRCWRIAGKYSRNLKKEMVMH